MLLLLLLLLHVLHLWLRLHVLLLLLLQLQLLIMIESGRGLLMHERRNHVHAMARSEEALGGGLGRQFEHRVALAVPLQGHRQDVLRAAVPQAPVVHVWEARSVGRVKLCIHSLDH